MKLILILATTAILSGCISSYKLEQPGSKPTATIRFSHHAQVDFGIFGSSAIQLFDNCPTSYRELSTQYIGNIDIDKEQKHKEVKVLANRAIYVSSRNAASNIGAVAECEVQVMFIPKADHYYEFEQHYDRNQCWVKVYEKNVENISVNLAPWSTC